MFLEGLKKFLRWLTNIRQSPLKGRILSAEMIACTAVEAWWWISDPQTAEVSMVESLLFNHTAFLMACVVLVGLVKSGFHKGGINRRTRNIRRAKTMSSDD